MLNVVTLILVLIVTRSVFSQFGLNTLVLPSVKNHLLICGFMCIVRHILQNVLENCQPFNAHLAKRLTVDCVSPKVTTASCVLLKIERSNVYIRKVKTSLRSKKLEN